ncbi:MAG: glycosyltransferase family 2 protein [Gemmatimonadota bacterium]
MIAVASPRPTIVVLTPVRNEAWILERFLSVTSQFADLIILADQGSDDDTAAIAARFPKVVVVANEDRGFDEAHRQDLLIAAARERAPMPRILLAFDADEILAADAMDRAGWRTMLAAPPGTVLSFERVDLFLTTERCMRHDPWRPLGYVDDGARHVGRTIHGGRIPLPHGAPNLKVADVLLLHYAALRTAGMASKLRWYSVLENVLGTCPHVLKRRLRYVNHLDFTGHGRIEPSRSEWFAEWERRGIDMRTVLDPPYHWYDLEVLRAFKRYDTRRFWLDDIWRFDWDACLDWAKSQGFGGLPGRPVRTAPDWLVFVMRGVEWVHRHQVRARHRLSGRTSRRFK